MALEGWLSSAAANDLLASAGHDLLDLARRAERPRFEPVDLGIAATAHLDNRLRRIRSFNVAGAVPGSDPEVADEHVVYTAHWDHFGVGDPVDGDRVYNGALDNATGVAGLLELAEAFAGLEVAPRRSVLFLAVTAEEQGLLGTRHYVQNPTVPLSKTLAAINLDGLNVWGPTRDVTVIGMGKTTLEDRLARILDEAQDGRTLTPDPEPDKGYYYRSDQFPFAQAGVPALYIDDGVEYEGRPEGFADRVREEYLAEHYHQPSDEFSDEWDLSGAELDVRALFRVGFDVAMGETWPTWKEGAEFRAARREMLEGSTEGD